MKIKMDRKALVIGRSGMAAFETFLLKVSHL